MGVIGAQKFSVEQTTVEKGCVAADAVIVSLADLLVDVQETNEALQADMLGEMYVNFIQATGKLERQLTYVKRYLVSANEEVRLGVSNAKTVEQDAIAQIGGSHE